jgi:poly-gamma-glutamate synthesis protein (capsule biosynthesis protein)
LRTVVATGDVIPARGVDNAIRRHGDDFLYPIAATAALTRTADLTVVNLEAPLVSHCGPAPPETFTFCGRPGFVWALSAAGVDIATLENNHIGNYGPQGIEETIGHLNGGAIGWADRNTPAVREIRGLRFGFLAFNAVGERVDRGAMAAQIQALRPQVDVLVVAVHWGAEYVRLPQAAPGIADDNPVEIGHLAVDSGADLVIGNHPHWVQAIEAYQGRFIAYAHGNFIFDQMWSYETRVGVVGRYTFYDTRLVKAEFVPVLIQDYARPVPMQGAEGLAVLAEMQRASAELAAMLAQ